MLPLENQFKTIGIFTGSMSSNYHEGIITGAHRMAKELQVNLIIFAGGPFHSDNSLVQSRDQLFNTVDPSLLDALIIPLSSLTRYMEDVEIKDLIQKYEGIPIINIGTEYEGLINIMPNYYQGMEKLMEHFVVEHDYRRIALLRGPENHDSSNLRYEIYRSLLDKYQIPYDESLIITGDLERNSIVEFVDALVELKMDIDAIIAVNSNATLTLIDALKRENIFVPKDVAFAGMTGISDEFYSTPELTLLNENFQLLGSTAVKYACLALSQKVTKKNVWIDMELSIGESCGCASMSNHNIEFNSINTIDVKSLYEQSASSKSSDIFLKSLYNYLKSKLITDDFLSSLSITYYYYKKYVINELVPSNYQDYENMIDKYLHMTSSLYRNALRYRRHETMNYINFLRDIGNVMNTSYDLDNINQHIVTALGVNDCYINIFDSLNVKKNIMRNINSIKDGQSLNLQDADKFFSTSSLIHPSTPKYDERFSMIFFPLIFRTEYFGNLIVKYDGKIRGSAFEALETIISTTVMNELQLQNLMETQSRFNDMIYNSRDWLFETDIYNTIIYCSDTVEDILQYSSEDILYQSIDRLIFSEDRSCKEFMSSHEDFNNIRCKIYNRNGDVKYCTMTAKSIWKDDSFTGYRGVIKDVTKQYIQDERIKILTAYDSLTGLQNRTMFENRILKCIDAYESFAVVYLNINRFKKINDSLGHTVGDKLLQEYAEQLKHLIKNTENLSRISGDEFALLLLNTFDASDVYSQIIEITTKLSKPFILGDQQIYITTSTGTAMYPADGTTTDVLIKCANSALNRAKDTGYTQHMFFNKSFDQQNAINLKVESLLHNAIQTDAFVVEYQPQVNLTTGTIASLEALVRIKDGDELVYPSKFIDVAEELGLIGQIDLKVLSIVCSECSQLLNNDNLDIQIAVNLSAAQLRTKNLCSQYMSILKQYNVSPTSIHIELTESALISNEMIAIQNMLDFKERGFAIDLDDFGTGYASLSCFATYPFNTIKIDRSFVTNAVKDEKTFNIIKAVTDMANTLGIKIVAEGVENLSQLMIMKSLNVNFVQGYFFEKPKNMCEFEERIIKKIPYEMVDMDY